MIFPWDYLVQDVSVIIAYYYSSILSLPSHGDRLTFVHITQTKYTFWEFLF